jgi:hypothetical protein
MPALTAKRRLLSDSPITMDSLGPPSERCLSKIAHSQISRSIASASTRGRCGCARRLGEYHGERSGTGSLLPAQAVFVERVDGARPAVKAQSSNRYCSPTPDSPHRWTQAASSFPPKGQLSRRWALPCTRAAHRSQKCTRLGLEENSSFPRQSPSNIRLEN